MYTARMLYTGKGDNGTMKTLKEEPGKRISKASAISEALGSLDEVNSFLGVVKMRAKAEKRELHGIPFIDIVHGLQKNLFIVQAEVAGAEKTIEKNKVTAIEKLVDTIEKELPPITTFSIAGGTELSALFDTARAMARRTERKVIAVADEGERSVGEHTRAFLNRLSSILFALARLTNRQSAIKEDAPDYR